MNKFVFKKVAEFTTEKTELSEVKVDLGVIDEAKKGMQMVLKAFNNPLWKTLERLPSEVGDTLARIKDELAKAGEGQRMAIENARKAATMSKELGVELPKDVQDIFDNNDYDDMVQSYESGISKLLSFIKK